MAGFGERGRVGGVFWAATLVGLLASAAHGQLGDLSIGDHLAFSASNRARGELVSWFDPAGPASNNDYAFFANRLRFGATLSFPTLEIFVEGQDTRLVNLPGADSIAPGLGPLGPGALYFANTRDRDQGELFLHRAYATLRRFGLPGVSVSVGRLGYNHGLEQPPKDPALAWLQAARISQRLIGNFDYTNVGRSFDGVQLTFEQGPFDLTALASHPTQGGFNVNANQNIDEIDLASVTGTLAEPRGIPMSAQLFYIYYGDRRDLAVADNRPLNPPEGLGCTDVSDPDAFRACDDSDLRISTIGANATHLIPLGPGKLDLLGWVAGQLGDWESLDHGAWGYAAELGYQLADVPARPWLRVGFFRSSGDDDAADGDHGTFFQLIPTARVYALFPFYNLMNNQDLFAQLLLKPLPGGAINVSGHWLRTTESRDLWYAGGGATSDTFFGFSGIPARGRNTLAYLVDLELSYTVNKHVALYGYYGHAFGQGVVAANFRGEDADYGFVELTLSY